MRLTVSSASYPPRILFLSWHLTSDLTASDTRDVRVSVDLPKDPVPPDYFEPVDAICLSLVRPCTLLFLKMTSLRDDVHFYRIGLTCLRNRETNN